MKKIILKVILSISIQNKIISLKELRAVLSFQMTRELRVIFNTSTRGMLTHFTKEYYQSNAQHSKPLSEELATFCVYTSKVSAIQPRWDFCAKTIDRADVKKIAVTDDFSIDKMKWYTISQLD